MTNHPARLALFVCALFIYFSATNVSHANLKIAVVDIEQILAKSKASESIAKQVKSKKESFFNHIKDVEDELRKEKKAIEEQAIKLQKDDPKKDEFIKKAEAYEKNKIEARNSIQDKKKSLDQAYTGAMGTLTKVIFDVCQELADERQIDLVITRQNIIVGNMSLDITKDVMDRLNKKLPNIALQVK